MPHTLLAWREPLRRDDLDRRPREASTGGRCGHSRRGCAGAPRSGAVRPSGSAAPRRGGQPPGWSGPPGRRWRASRTSLAWRRNVYSPATGASRIPLPPDRQRRADAQLGVVLESHERRELHGDRLPLPRVVGVAGADEAVAAEGVGEERLAGNRGVVPRQRTRPGRSTRASTRRACCPWKSARTASMRPPPSATCSPSTNRRASPGTSSASRYSWYSGALRKPDQTASIGSGPGAPADQSRSSAASRRWQRLAAGGRVGRVQPTQAAHGSGGNDRLIDDHRAVGGGRGEGRKLPSG